MWSQEFLKKARKSEYDRLLLSKCWGIEAVFHSVNFHPFFCWSLKKSCCDNIETTLRKIFLWKCDISFFEITLPPHRCLLGNLSFTLRGHSWCLFVVMMIFIPFIVIDLFQSINLRSILSGGVLGKKYSLYIQETPKKTKILCLTFFQLKFRNFLNCACFIVVFNRALVLDIE